MSPRPSGLTAFFFNFDPQQADDIFLIKYEAGMTEVGDRCCALPFH
jgi:hypothetical protein